MTCRCPYCKQDVGASPPPKCPGCGRVMLVPAMRDPNPRVARKRKIENIWRECERKKAELHGPAAPGVWRNPKFYFGVIVVLAAVGGAVFQATDSAVKRQAEAPHRRALRHVDVLAEALGRYRFHTGVYPTREQGLAALVRDPVTVPKWDGPYINQLRNDPWGTPYVYEPSDEGPPKVFSCGPDKTRGTPDDLHPDPARFDPGTEWTNGWVSADQRLPGVKILKSVPAGRQ